MNRIIKVSRTTDYHVAGQPVSSIRVEIYSDQHAAPDEALTCTPDEMVELASILHLLHYNASLSSVTGSVSWRREDDKGGAS